jgi:hypothetical protein
VSGPAGHAVRAGDCEAGDWGGLGAVEFKT